MKKATVSVVKLSLIILFFISAISLSGCTSKRTIMNIGGNQSSSRSIVPIIPIESSLDQIAGLLISHSEMKDDAIYLYFEKSREFVQVSGAASIFKSYIDPEGNSKLDGGGKVYFIEVIKHVNTPRSPDQQMNIYEHPIIGKDKLLYNDGKQPQRLMRVNNYPGPQLNSPQTTVTVNKGGHTFYFVWAEPETLTKGTCYGARLESRRARFGDLLPAFCH